MNLLLDTQAFVWWVELDERLSKAARTAIADSSRVHVSVATAWEIAIKVRLKKLEFGMELDQFPDACNAAGVEILAVTSDHVLAEAMPLPATRDPFDRLLLAQASVEGMRLVTFDRALVDHPLAWAP